jgi:predicted DNA-binding transcriptional regulator YafY
MHLFFQMLDVIYNAKKWAETTPNNSTADEREQAEMGLLGALHALPRCHKKEPVGAKECTFRYRNYKGEEGMRRVIPGRIYWDASEWHPEPQWLFDAWDLDKEAHRTFALKDVLAWRED